MQIASAILGLAYKPASHADSRSQAVTANSSATDDTQAIVQSGGAVTSSAGALSDKEIFSKVGEGARAQLNAQYSDAAKSGSRVTYDSLSGTRPDYSKFSDQELAAIALNRDGGFSKDERDYAGGTLTERTRVALEPFNAAVMHGADRRGHATAINMLYSGMSPEVRGAMGWTPTMMSANNSMLQGDLDRLGPIDDRSVLRSLLGTKATGRGLAMDFLETKQPLTYSPSSVGVRIS